MTRAKSGTVKNQLRQIMAKRNNTCNIRDNGVCSTCGRVTREPCKGANGIVGSL